MKTTAIALLSDCTKPFRTFGRLHFMIIRDICSSILLMLSFSCEFRSNDLSASLSVFFGDIECNSRLINETDEK